MLAQTVKIIYALLLIGNVGFASHLINPGFEKKQENKVDGWTGWSWAPDKQKADTEQFWMAHGGRNDSACLGIKVEKNGHVGVWCNTQKLLDKQPEGPYVLSVWIRSAESDIVTCRLGVGFTDQHGAKGGKAQKQSFDIYPNNVWQKLSMPVYVSNSLHRIRIDIFLLSPGTILLDDISFTPEKEVLHAPGNPFVLVGKAVSPPIIDADIDDECWQQSIECSNFLLTGDRGLPKANTSAWVCYDDSYLYFAFKCDEKFLNPVLNLMHRFKSECKRHDGSVWLDDSIEIFIQTQTGTKYQLIINSIGTVYDTILGNDVDPAAWNSGVEVLGATKHDFWTIEVALPLSAIGISNISQKAIQRLNMCRTRQPIHEFSSWSPAPKGFIDDSCWGYVKFQESTLGISCSPLKVVNTRNIELKATIKANDKSDIHTYANVGVDGKYRWTFTDEKKLPSAELRTAGIKLNIPEKLAGVESRYADLDYSFVDRKQFLYQSPSFRFKLGKSSYRIFSRLGKLIPHSSEFKTLSNIAIPEGQTEFITLILSSAKFDQLPKELHFILEMPICCSLISPLHNRNSISPRTIKESLVDRGGDKYRRYTMIFPKNVVMESDAPEWELLPIPLFIKLAGSGQKHTVEPKIYFQAFIPSIDYYEEEKSLPLITLPPFSQKHTSKKLAFMIWPWLPFYAVSQHSEEERNSIFKKWHDAGFNTVSTELQLNEWNLRRTIRDTYGFNTMKMMPILTAGTFPGAAQYLKNHPEQREVSFAGREVNFICFADLLKSSHTFTKTINKVIGSMAKTYQLIHVDYEFDIFGNNAPGYSKKNIEIFRKEYDIEKIENLSIELLEGKYREQWTDFRCRQNGEILKLYRQTIKKSNPDCIFAAYSAYQASGLKRAHYGVDWNSFSKYLDLVICGYGRGDYRTTRKAIGATKPFAGGEGVWEKDYDTMLAEVRLFQRVVDCGTFMLFYDGIDDGYLYSAVSRVIGTVADFEEFFLSHRRADNITEVLNQEVLPRDSVAVLLNTKGERLLVLLNETDEVKQFKLKNKKLPKHFIAVDYFEKKVINNPEELACKVAAKTVKVIYLCSIDNTIPYIPTILNPTLKLPPQSQFPVFVWEHNGRTSTYSFELRKKINNTTISSKQNIPENFTQSTASLSPGAYEWRVAACNVQTDKQGSWSAWTTFIVPSVFNTDEYFHVNSRLGQKNKSIEKLGKWVPMDWGGYENIDGISYIGRDYDVTMSGTYSLQITKTKNNSPFWSSHYRNYPGGSIPIKVKPGERYRFSAWVKNSNKTVRSKISIVCSDENMLSVKNVSSLLTGKTKWTEVTIEIEIPPTAIRMGFVLSSSGGEGTSWFDCFTLKHLSK